ncbi:hypothetical protein Vadar_019901 [Vaccinium darrowii]|uniref:Uncharacterized protein n=1 Tax=Vaccinium darrowii TaxID=229202 RepID=A0ACB7YF89_9ERIC|nr:hypothetical protein Vadar_019901 [Vaccinium darrowii]
MHQLLHFLALFFVLVSQVPVIKGDIKTMTFSSDSRRTIFLKDFCFDHTGHVTLNITNVSITTTSTTPINSSRIGVFFGVLYNIPYYGEVLFFGAGIKTCILESPHLVPGGLEPIATFDELSPRSSVNKTLPIPAFTLNNNTQNVTIDHLGIYFSNCEPNTSVSMNVNLETYNIDGNGKDYLPFGSTLLPTVYFIFSVLYLPFLAFWVNECYKNRLFVRNMHVLMSILVVVKSLNLFFNAEDKHNIKVTGTPHGWDVWFYMFYGIRTLLLVTIIMLIGTGWTIMKPMLQAKEKVVLAIGIGIQLVGTIAHIYSDEMGPSDSQYLYSIIAFFIIDFLGFSIVFVPIYFSMKSLKEAAKTDGTAARDLGKLRLLQYFNGCVYAFWLGKLMAWIYIHQVTADNCGVEWLFVTTIEILTFGFYILIFHLFKPRRQNEYFAVEDEEMALATIQREFADI